MTSSRGTTTVAFLGVRPIQTQRERRSAPLDHGSMTDLLRKQSLLLKFLAIDAERRPGDGLQALFADGVVAVGADGVGIVLHALESLVDEHEQVALAVGEGEVELF